jgi:hypothetical protein
LSTHSTTPRETRHGHTSNDWRRRLFDRERVAGIVAGEF